MYKAIPDLLSFSRIGLAMVLLLLEPLSFGFLAVFAVCSVTDILDGYAARRFGVSNEHGYMVDSISDAVLAVVMLYCIIPAVDWETWMIVWIAAIAAVRLVALGIGSGRHLKVAFVHTYLNKMAGLLLFLSPYLLVLIGVPVTVAVVCTVTSVSAAEYLYVNISSERYDPDFTTVFAGRP